MAVNLGFLKCSRYLSFNYLLNYLHEPEWTPFLTQCYSENLEAPGIDPDPRTSSSVARTSDHLTADIIKMSQKEN
jgi:hypothetical protein